MGVSNPAAIQFGTLAVLAVLVWLVMPQNLRRLVSKKKRRFEQEGWSLDLAYITP
ncbi:hypothetical protein KIPB_015302, partial [Kipferlia bialata]|eukprot:g15302.t1